MARHFKVEELLGEVELDEFREFCRAPALTINEAHDWMLGRGYTLSRSATATWLAKYKEELTADRMRSSGSLAKAFLEAAKDSGGLAVPDAATGEVEVKDLNSMALAMQRLMLAKARLDTTRSEFEARDRKAIEESAKLAKAGGDGNAIADRVREILGGK